MQIINAPVISSKFLRLKILNILLFSWHNPRHYDYLSLVSFFEASPSLEKFVLHVSHCSPCKDYLITMLVSWISMSWPLTFRYELRSPSMTRLRETTRLWGECQSTTMANSRVGITGFYPQKSMLELTCHILEKTTSLRRLTLDTFPANYRRSSIFHSKCAPLETADIREAHKSVLAVKTYIEEKVPSAVKFNILEPCSRCYALWRSDVKSSWFFNVK